jgi:hypothetical protein
MSEPSGTKNDIALVFRCFEGILRVYRPKLLKFLDFPRFPGHTKDYIHTSLGTVILGLQLAPLSLHKSVTGVTFNLQDGLDSLSEVWPGRKHFRDRWRMTSMILSTFYPPQIGEHIFKPTIRVKWGKSINTFPSLLLALHCVSYNPQPSVHAGTS